jgi:folate-dependent tRNA-U54 methylase TrmFO/GidA
VISIFMTTSLWCASDSERERQYIAALAMREKRLHSAHQQGKLADLTCPPAIRQSKSSSARRSATPC